MYKIMQNFTSKNESSFDPQWSERAIDKLLGMLYSKVFLIDSTYKVCNLS